MPRKPAPPGGYLALTAAAMLMLGGCASTATDEGPKKIVDGTKMVLLDAPTGSHIKRRVPLIDANQPTISPTTSNKITADTDTNIPPATVNEMLRMSGPTGR
jgi:hypothetical protein